MLPKRKKILSVKIVQLADESPDTSYLGEYSSTWKDGCIDREERGDRGRNEHRYFHPAMTGEEAGNPDSPEQDYQRMESLSRGAWWFIGIRAVAKIQLQHNGPIQTIESGGLWGIESDSDRAYFDEVRREELSALRGELESLGFSKRTIDRAFENIEED